MPRLLQIQPVAKLVVGDGGGEEPGIATVEGPRLELDAVEGGRTLRPAEDLLGDAGAEIAGEGDAGAAVAHAVVDAVFLPAEMGQGVEGIGDESHPAMGDPDRR